MEGMEGEEGVGTGIEMQNEKNIVCFPFKNKIKKNWSFF